MRIERRLTIDELAERPALSRSTIYYWVRDLPLPGSGPGGGWPQSAHRAAGRAIKRKYRLLREAAYKEGLESFDELSIDPTSRDFVCLYTAEGYKRPQLGSDLQLRRRRARARALLDTPPDRQATRIRDQYHADQNLDELHTFWSELLGISPEAIRFQRKSNSGELKGRQRRSRHGVRTARVSDTYLWARLRAWMDRLRSAWPTESG